MSRPRVLVNALAFGSGGGRAYLTNVLRELARDDRGLAITLLAQRGRLDGLDLGGVEPLEIELPGRSVLSRLLYEELVLPFRARDFDVLYCTNDLSPAFGKCPTVVLLRNLNIYDRRWYDDRRTRTLARMVGWGVPRARRLLFPSRAAADLIGRHVEIEPSRVRVVPYGIDTAIFASTRVEREPFVFLPAAVERHKNVELAIRGLAASSDAALELRIAGGADNDPAYRAELDGLAAELGVAERVRYLGQVPYGEIARLYAAARATLFPSFIETFGHPVLESMASGTPVICSEIPTFREIAGDAATFVGLDDAAAMGAAIDAADPASDRIVTGRRRAAEFCWSRTVDGLAEVLHEVAGEG